MDTGGVSGTNLDALNGCREKSMTYIQWINLLCLSVLEKGELLIEHRWYQRYYINLDWDQEEYLLSTYKRDSIHSQTGFSRDSSN